MADYRLFVHDCRRMPELSDGSVHCVVTSPPYWGLRHYTGEQVLIWGGKERCRHEWGPQLSKKNRGSVGKNATVSYNVREIQGNRTSQGNLCRKCGAWRGAFGNEPTVGLYLQHSVEILREVRRVLRPDGTVWWNVGDSYASGKGTCLNPGGGSESLEKHATLKGAGAYPLDRGNASALALQGLKPKDLALIPHKLAVALQADGWWVRTLIIWNKSNPMPESVNGWRWEKHRIKVKPGVGGRRDIDREEPMGGISSDDPDDMAEFVDCPGCPKCSKNAGLILVRGSWRPTETHEYILQLAKSPHYFGDKEAVREAYSEPLNRWGGSEIKAESEKHAEYLETQKISPSSVLRAGTNLRPDAGGRNLRSVWTFPTRPLPKRFRHFASFPERLPETCIKASTSAFGVCPKCGAPFARIVEKVTGTSHAAQSETRSDDKSNAGRIAKLRQAARKKGEEYLDETRTMGWKPTCRCGIGTAAPATVLDLFCGSGTTLLTAIRLGRDAVGYDISADYKEIIQARVKNIQIELTAL